MNLLLFTKCIVFVSLMSVCCSKILPRPLHKGSGPLCGSDFQNYANKERFLIAQKRNPELFVLHKRYCRKSCQIYQPVCGSDSKSYNNECQLEFAKKRDKSLRVIYKGRCSRYGKEKTKMISYVGYEYYYDSDEADIMSEKCALN